LKLFRAPALVFFSLLAIQLRALELSADGLRVALPPYTLHHRWALGEHRRTLDLTLTREATVSLNGTRVEAALTHSNPNLSTKLLESLHSAAKSGFTTIARTRSFEAKLGRVKELSVDTDAQGRVWVRAIASIRLQAAKSPARAEERRITLELGSSSGPGGLRLTPRSLEIAGVEAELTRRILASLGSVEIPTPACLRDVEVRLEGISFPRRANTVVVRVSLPAREFAALARCLSENSEE